MKKLLYSFGILVASVPLICGQAPQSVKGKKDSVSPYSVTIQPADQPPSFPGGVYELNKFINANIKFPEKDRTDSTFRSCKVFVKFMVDESGKVSEPQILKGCKGFDECDREVLRIIGLMPAWSPALQDGKPVKRAYSLPVGFTLK